MKKVLILTYFFPPGNFAGSYRIASWVKYLHEYGYYPVVITRHWDAGQSGFSDISENKNIRIEKDEKAEIHYLPYRGNFRDKLLRKSKDKFSFLRRLLTTWEIVIQNFTIRVIPFNNLYYYSKKYLDDHQDINIVIISAKPFILFHFGYLLKKHYPYLNWIADYRDPWNTHEYFNKVQNKQIRAIESNRERKWLSKATLITSCSELWCRQIETFTGIKTRIIYNGYDISSVENDQDKSLIKRSSVFTLVHNGSLYRMQNIENIIDSVIRLIETGKQKIKVIFYGVANDDVQVARIREKTKGFRKYFETTSRLPKEEIDTLLLRADLFLIFGTDQLKGWYPVKLFEYLAAGKPILMSPSDHDVIENTIRHCKAGFVSDQATDVYNYLLTAYSQWEEHGKVQYNGDRLKIEKYSRRKQTETLVALLNRVFSGGITNPKISSETGRFRDLAFTSLFKVGVQNIIHKKVDRDRIRVLCFHNIALDSGPAYPSLSPEHFRKLILYFSKEYDIIALSNITDIPHSAKRPMILTFDDGYSNFYSNALPVLKEFNLPAQNSIIVDCVETGKPFWTQRLNYMINHIYRNNRGFHFNYEGIVLSSGGETESPQFAAYRIYLLLLHMKENKRNEILNQFELNFEVPEDRQPGLMNWEQVEKCVQSGIEIGSHTMSHDSLDTIDSEEHLRYEIIQSKERIEKKLNIKVNALAFPNGRYNDHCLKIAEQAGYKMLLTTEENHLILKKEKEITMPLLIPRISLSRNRFQEDVLRAENFHRFFRFKKSN